MNKQFETLQMGEPWTSCIGNPEPHGTWFIYGPPKNGKTSFAMQLARRLAELSLNVAYASIEEGLSLTVQNAYRNAGIHTLNAGITLVSMEFKELCHYLAAKRAPDALILDSIQFYDLTFAQYKNLKLTFPRKLFIYISHVSGRLPEGNVARRIWRDAAISFRIEGFRAFPVSRYGGEAFYTVNPERSAKYWNTPDIINNN
jgi:hypothetical protein